MTGSSPALIPLRSPDTYRNLMSRDRTSTHDDKWSPSQNLTDPSGRPRIGQHQALRVDLQQIVRPNGMRCAFKHGTT
jgi:hypothetical protein